MFCWHHSDEIRLKLLLKRNRVDCPSLDFLTNNGLKPGAPLRFSIKVLNQELGKIVAEAELNSNTPMLLIPPLNKQNRFYVNLKSVRIINEGEFCKKYPSPSHRVSDDRGD
jgi:hypothetical protein